jgi:8-oxo-dGTP pyrophosphatase MutT (NUDIX family)
MTTGRAGMAGVAIHPIDRVDLVVEPWSWPFATARRADIAAHFAALRVDRPKIWNGRVLLMRRCEIAGGTFRGACFETDYASLLAWRDWGWCDPHVWNGFSMGALRSADGAFLAGVMAAHTAYAGQVYFPSGTPEPADVGDGKLDLDANLRREVAEETGLTPDDFTAAPGWTAVFAGQRIALMKTLEVPLPAEELRRRILAHLARDAEPEFADIRIVRAPCDLDPMMPDFVTAFLAHAWR